MRKYLFKSARAENRNNSSICLIEGLTEQEIFKKILNKELTLIFQNKIQKFDFYNWQQVNTIKTIKFKGKQKMRNIY